MATPSIHRFDVVQRKEAYELIANAIERGQNAELDLMSETDAKHVSFRVTATDHDHADRTGIVVFGTTTDHQSINVFLERNANGELEAVRASIG